MCARVCAFVYWIDLESTVLNRLKVQKPSVSAGLCVYVCVCVWNTCLGCWRHCANRLANDKTSVSVRPRTELVSKEAMVCACVYCRVSGHSYFSIDFLSSTRTHPSSPSDCPVGYSTCGRLSTCGSRLAHEQDFSLGITETYAYVCESANMRDPARLGSARKEACLFCRQCSSTQLLFFVLFVLGTSFHFCGSVGTSS